MLTGVCKEDFDKWYKKEFEKRNLPYTQGFEISDLSIQHGVLLDFFDSKDIIVDVQPFLDYDEAVYIKVMYWMARVVHLNTEPNEDSYNDAEYKTRSKAIKSAIKKANEVYNSQKEL